MKLLPVILILFFYISINSLNGEIIKIGGYSFPPFVEKNEDEFVGVAIELIKVLNEFQNKYEFIFVPTSPVRRYADFDNNFFDLMMFEDMAWGWSSRDDVVSSSVFLEGGEVYITRTHPTKDQGYFDDISSKSISGILGYHYGFAGFSGDEKYLKENFNMELSSSHEGNIRKVLAGRTDISVVTLSYLNRYLNENPSKRAQLLISEKFDQRYHHTILIRKNGTISVSEINRLLTQMKEQGELDRLWKKYGIKR